MIIRDFFSVVEEDTRITSAHISLYLALINEWYLQDKPDWIRVDRQRLMALAKLNGRATYDRCIHDLHSFRYINYQPKRARKATRLSFNRLV